MYTVISLKTPMKTAAMNFFSRLLIALICLSLTACAVDTASKPTITPLIKATSSWDGKPITYPSGQAEITGLMIEIPVGRQTGWHMHPVPSFGMVMQGTLEVDLKDGQTKHLQEGDTLVEVVNTAHNGRNVGDKPVKILVFYAGFVGNKLTIGQH